MSLVYGCCVGDWDRFTRNVAPRVGDARLITVKNATSIASAYNAILVAAARFTPKAVVLLHDDLELGDTEDWLDAKISQVLDFDKDIGVIGCIGARDVTSLAWWEGQKWGSQQTDSGWVHGASVASEDAVDVDAVDGSLIIVNGNLLHGLGARFDENYPGFHGYDVDFCRRIRNIGLRVVVTSIRTHHHTTLGFKSTDVHREWLAAYETYREKWDGRSDRPGIPVLTRSDLA